MHPQATPDIHPNPYSAIEKKIAAARSKLILDKPFLGALVLRLPLQAADPSWCPTTGTDACRFYYNPEYINSLKPLELQFVLAHEALHCALSHFARRQHRVKHRWDLACDYAINPVLLDEGFTPPPGVQIMSHYRSMTAEEIYPLLKDNDLAETMDQHLYDKPDQKKGGGKNQQDNPQDEKNQHPDKTPESKQPNRNTGGEQQSKNQPQTARQQQSKKAQDINPENTGLMKAPPPPLSEKMQAILAEKWQQRMAGAAQQATQAGKMSSIMQRLMESQLKPKLPWRTLLARYFSATARDDYAWQRPSSRRGDPAIYPSLKSAQINIALAVDVSGSITAQELAEALAEVNVLKSQVRARVTLMPFDSQIIAGYPLTVESWDELAFSNTIAGGGGTDFYPVFEWLDKLDLAPDLLVIFTDGMGRFPHSAPHYPTIWLIKGKKTTPWGKRIQLN